MRFRQIDRYLLLLAGLFVLAILRRTDFPGEEVLPDLYRATIHKPLLAQVSGALAQPQLDLTRLRSELEAAHHENAQLRQQLDSRRELGRYFRGITWRRPPIARPAWVLSVENDLYVQTFQIDEGSSSGIASEMAVVTGKALLGRVTHVMRRLATVRRVDDPNFRIEIEVALGDGEYARGVAQGNGARGLEVRFLRAAKVAPGAAVFTSAHDKKIPAGLLVGWLEKVEDAERDGVLEVTVTPAAALGRLSQVEVLELR